MRPYLPVFSPLRAVGQAATLEYVGSKDLATKFTEEQVHQHLFQQGLESVIDDAPAFDAESLGEPVAAPESAPLDETGAAYDGVEFELWRIVKAKALEKLGRLHRRIRYGEFIGSKVKLPIDSTRPIELDLLGQHEDGLFILELKVDRSAERNAFSELYAYSNHIAGMFALSGHKDIANVLVANLDVKITRQAFLYDLLITDRNIIVYTFEFSNGTLGSLRLKLHVPTDDDFRYFTNQLLSHDPMSCVVASFHDMEGWIDNAERGENPPAHTVKHLTALSSYAAQLMEAEHLHGFCFIRKPWPEVTLYYPNSLIMCALNPFKIADAERSNAITAQLEEKYHAAFFEGPMLGFDGRLAWIARRAVRDCLTNSYHCELEFPLWSAMVTSSIEVVFTHNFGFRPTGVMRDAYVSYLTSIYDHNETGGDQDVSTLKLLEISNWLRAWEFMEMCGFAGTGNNEVDEFEDEGEARSG